MLLTTSAFSSGKPTPSRFSRFTRATRWLRRTTFLIHRWLGIALALLMTLWAASGIVMMYVSYPETTAEERARSLAWLDFSECCADVRLPQGEIERAEIAMFLGYPALRWSDAAGPQLLGLAGPIPPFDRYLAGRVAGNYVDSSEGANVPVRVERIDVDQWTLQQQRYAPLYKASFNDPDGMVLYVSGLTGEVVQDTTANERFWNWLGAVPHWLYFTPLRKGGVLWSQVVIWASLLGTFLALTGLYVGLRMYGRGKRKSPFRGIALWHHWTGLIFGVATLTWVFSGLASMQPWGWLESEGPGEELRALAGRSLTGSDAEALIQALAAHPQREVVAAEVVVQGGEPWAVLVRADGSRMRASLPDLMPAPPTDAELRALAAAPGTPIPAQGPITEGDAYHYSHHSAPAVLPAWRVIYADADQTRLYLDPRTGEPIRFVDAGSRGFRWWHLALHRLDFGGLDARPLWDAIMLPLIAGITLLCGLGVWMGVRRLARRERREK